MPNQALAFPLRLGAKLASGEPPLAEARALVDALYFDEVCSIVDREPITDSRGGFTMQEVFRTDLLCHVTKVSNQRGAFTQGSTSASGHGPLTSASLWYIYFPLGTGIEIGDVAQLVTGTRLSIIGRADEATWRVMEAFRATELGINQ